MNSRNGPGRSLPIPGETLSPYENRVYQEIEDGQGHDSHGYANDEPNVVPRVLGAQPAKVGNVSTKPAIWENSLEAAPEAMVVGKLARYPIHHASA